MSRAALRPAVMWPSAPAGAPESSSVPTSAGASGPLAPGVTVSSPPGTTPGPAPGSSQIGPPPPPAPPPATPRVQVTAVEYSFTLSRASVPAGKVIFEFVNRGQDEHNLNVQPAEGVAAGAFPDTASGGISDQAMILRAGTYTMFCSLSEHEQKGMKATLVVQ